jgi:hypothetical protein
MCVQQSSITALFEANPASCRSVGKQPSLLHVRSHNQPGVPVGPLPPQWILNYVWSVLLTRAAAVLANYQRRSSNASHVNAAPVNAAPCPLI